MALVITDQNFDEIVGDTGIAVVDFWAEWCAPCRKLGPVIDEVAAEHKDVRIGKVNVDQNPTKSVEHGVMSIPTVVFFKDGNPVERRKGLMSKQDIEKIIEKLKGAE
jgi:thioredoxin 1